MIKKEEQSHLWGHLGHICGENHNKISIHAEQKCLEFCRIMIRDINMKSIFGDIQKEGKIKPSFAVAPVQICFVSLIMGIKYSLLKIIKDVLQ